MKIEVLNATTAPDRLDELQIETLASTHIPDGVVVDHPLLLDVRNQEDLLLYRLHLTYDEADQLGQTLRKLKIG